MSRVRLVSQEGYGTEPNPVHMGSEKLLETGIVLTKNEQIRGVVITDFEKDEDGAVSLSPEILPVIPYEYINHLVGKVLTVVDAVASSKEQREASRTLVMKEIWEWYDSHRTAASHKDLFNK